MPAKCKRLGGAAPGLRYVDIALVIWHERCHIPRAERRVSIASAFRVADNYLLDARSTSFGRLSDRCWCATWRFC